MGGIKKTRLEGEILLILSVCKHSARVYSFLTLFFWSFRNFDNTIPNNDNDREKWIVGSRGAKCYYKFFKARQKLHQSTPYRYKYNLGLANITSVDEDDVGRMVSQKALWHKLAGRPTRPLHLLSFNGREVFCFSTKLIAFPANVNAVRIGLMVVSPEGAEVEAKEGEDMEVSDDEVK